MPTPQAAAPGSRNPLQIGNPPARFNQTMRLLTSPSSALASPGNLRHSTRPYSTAENRVHHVRDTVLREVARGFAQSVSDEGLGGVRQLPPIPELRLLGKPHLARAMYNSRLRPNCAVAVWFAVRPAVQFRRCAWPCPDRSGSSPRDARRTSPWTCPATGRTRPSIRPGACVAKRFLASSNLPGMDAEASIRHKHDHSPREAS